MSRHFVPYNESQFYGDIGTTTHDPDDQEFVMCGYCWNTTDRYIKDELSETGFKCSKKEDCEGQE